jgi:hypothetical protein
LTMATFRPGQLPAFLFQPLDDIPRLHDVYHTH